ncbi:protein D2-like isoform X2 [Phymastichus coffea]|uniref:protein D2-like isoform X2 n=1 Tax=Phymastichus coffea TaxID=108790 RepID=UPI00273CAFEA|nr:protein D2-like isoform X2 [Phymastichus coffea]
MKLFAAGIAYCLLGIVTADIDDDYKIERIIPDVLDKAPINYLQISYNNKKVELGKELTPSEVKDAPLIEWNFDSSKFYTLILNDPDAPSRENPQMREFLHWAIVNIPGNDFAKGDTLAKYIGAGPPKDTGLHRYIFTVYQQPGKLTFEEKPMSDTSLDGRANFSLRKFAIKYNLNDPVSGNMFQAQYDDYVPLFYKNLGM